RGLTSTTPTRTRTGSRRSRSRSSRGSGGEAGDVDLAARELLAQQGHALGADRLPRVLGDRDPQHPQVFKPRERLELRRRKRSRPAEDEARELPQRAKALEADVGEREAIVQLELLEVLEHAGNDPVLAHPD